MPTTDLFIALAVKGCRPFTACPTPRSASQFYWLKTDSVFKTESVFAMDGVQGLPRESS